MFESYTTEYLQQLKGTAIARDKRFIISVPILVGTAIGVSSIATAGVTAAVIAKKESNRVINEVQANRIVDIENSIHNNKLNLNISVTIAKDLDNIRHTAAMATNAINSIDHTKQSNYEINHIFSKASTLEFSDPSTQE